MRSWHERAATDRRPVCLPSVTVALAPLVLLRPRLLAVSVVSAVLVSARLIAWAIPDAPQPLPVACNTPAERAVHDHLSWADRGAARLLLVQIELAERRRLAVRREHALRHLEAVRRQRQHALGHRIHINRACLENPLLCR